MIEIEIMDSVWTKTNEAGHFWLNNFLCYDHFYWRNNGFQKEKVIQKVWMLEVHTDGFYFHTGLVDKVLNYLDDQGEQYELTDNLPEIEVSEPFLKGITFRHYQKRLVDAGLDYGRGQLIAPTATGKSIILNGVISGLAGYNVLFLVHTKVLMKQMKEHIENAFPDEEIGEWSAKNKNMKRITVATIQSYVKIHRKYNDHFDAILIDEVHHVSGLETMYGKVLQMSTAHTKLGVTATRNAGEKGRWSAEALLGPVIGEYTLKEAREDKVVAEPTIHIYTNPFIDSLRKLPEYADKYAFGITENFPRNLKIVMIADEFIKQGKTTLITVTSIPHGKGLERIFREYGIEVQFIYGNSTEEEREAVKEGLKDKSTLCALSSVVFLEGVDIPSLDVVINAGAGVSPVQTMQRIGRALRKTETKDTAILVDFIDNVNPTLRRQSDTRIKLYKQNEWKIVYKEGN